MSASPFVSAGTSAADVIAGQPVVLDYGNVATEYAALRAGAMLVDRTARGRFIVKGARAREMITGIVTNDVNALTPGHGQYAAALTAKGKIVADVRIFAREGSLLIDTPPRAADGWDAMVRKFINPRLAPYRNASAELRQIGVFGMRSRLIVAGALGIAPAALGALPPYGHMEVHEPMEAMVANVPDLAFEGYEIFVAPAHFDTCWRLLSRAGATPTGLSAWKIARIEAGRPEWGVEIDATTIPQEANFDELDAISYTKGCYVGQEVVARVHFRGHVNKHLRGLLCGQNAPPPRNAALVTDAGKPAGEIRSTAVSPRLGAIALGMVRRDVEPGTTLTVQWEGGEAQADVSALPFPL
ncbi:MAG TPA: glycine cleavage T C-terminal barrel domain-containing protein [Gemmatimonadaceae bacterium]|nr:glycine cleavage T C-terminal barrel domain-containing protein [Gemmatimonadaceae bacterium]